MTASVLFRSVCIGFLVVCTLRIVLQKACFWSSAGAGKGGGVGAGLLFVLLSAASFKVIDLSHSGLSAVRCTSSPLEGGGVHPSVCCCAVSSMLLSRLVCAHTAYLLYSLTHSLVHRNIHMLHLFVSLPPGGIGSGLGWAGVLLPALLFLCVQVL